MEYKIHPKTTMIKIVIPIRFIHPKKLKLKDGRKSAIPRPSVGTSRTGSRLGSFYASPTGLASASCCGII